MMCSNHRPLHLLLNFSTQGNVICHDKHIIHSSIMHPVTFFPTVEYREGRKKCLLLYFFFKILSFLMPGFMERKKKNTGVSGRTLKCISPQWSAFAAARTTMALRIQGGHSGVVPVLEIESARRPGSRAPHLKVQLLQPPSLCLESQNKQPGQSPDTFPSNFHCRMCSFSA